MRVHHPLPRRGKVAAYATALDNCVGTIRHLLERLVGPRRQSCITRTPAPSFHRRCRRTPKNCITHEDFTHSHRGAPDLCLTERLAARLRTNRPTPEILQPSHPFYR